MAFSLGFVGLPRRSPACEEEEPLGATRWEPVSGAQGRAAGQALMSLFLLENTRQLPERRSNLWADQLMIYGLVLRPDTQGWHQPQTSCLETLPRGRQAARGRKSSCQLPEAAAGQPSPPGKG